MSSLLSTANNKWRPFHQFKKDSEWPTSVLFPLQSAYTIKVQFFFEVGLIWFNHLSICKLSQLSAIHLQREQKLIFQIRFIIH